MNKPEKPLFSPRYQLAGKPDYIIRQPNGWFPVEVKSGQYHQPQPHHTMQLAAYCALVEDTYKQFVPQGVLVYPTGSFTVLFNPEQRFHLEKTIQQMKQFKTAKVVQRNHQDTHKCRACSMRQFCSQKLI